MTAPRDGARSVTARGSALGSRVRHVVRRVRRGETAVEDTGPLELLQSLDESERAILSRVRPLTMTSIERILATIDATRYVASRGVPGSLVECGVWRGGSVLAMILTLQNLGIDDRDIYLYDTFAGMTEPTAVDVSAQDGPALPAWKEAAAQGRRAWDWAFAPDVYGLEQVRTAVLSSGYPESRMHFVAGPVEETIPGVAPNSIALVRLDTDWYESTRHELVHLYPRLESHGVLLIDDYGHWRGARRAVDEYFSEHPPRPMLGRIDYTGRIALKC